MISKSADGDNSAVNAGAVGDMSVGHNPRADTILSGRSLRPRTDLISQFALASLVFVIGAGFFLWWGLSVWAQNEATSHFIDISVASYNDIISHHIDADDFEAPMQGERLEDFDAFVKDNILSEETTQIKVWNKDSILIYSPNRRLIGTESKDAPKLEAALGGEVSARRVRYLGDGGANSGDTVKKATTEIYVPMESDGKALGVLEVYKRSRKLYTRIRSQQLFIGYTLAGTLSIFYFTFLSLMVGSAKKITNQNERLSQLSLDLSASLSELEESFAATLQTLMLTLHQKDSYTAGHSIRVADYALRIGSELRLTELGLKKLNQAALFHDIGKVAIPKEILDKPSRLNEKELEVIKRHPLVGCEIISPLKHMRELAPIVRHEHERFDGQGYPDGLKEEEIPLESRIIAVADSFDAMTSDRPYRKAMSREKACHELRANSGTQFDPQILDAFFKAVERPCFPKDTKSFEDQKEMILKLEVF